MKKHSFCRILFSFSLVLSSYFVFGQKINNKIQTPKFSQKEIEKLSKMNEDEIETYRKKLLDSYLKQAEQLTNNSSEILPNLTLPNSIVKLPAKNQNLINAANSLPADKITLLDYISKFKEIIKKEISSQNLGELNQLANSSDAAEISNNAVSIWYSNRREAALYLAALSLEKNSENLLVWNNLGALLNLSEIYALAIPIFRYILEKSPNSSMALNNIGQSYLGLGDIDKSESYLKKCLFLDSMNPEANRSMAFISIAKSKNDDASEFFKKEIKIAFRSSSWSMIEAQGLEDKVNISEVIDKNDARNFSIVNSESYSFYDTDKISAKGPNANFFAENVFPSTEKKSTFQELHLSKFVLPVFPKNSEQAELYVGDFVAEQYNLQNEIQYWQSRTVPNESQKEMLSQKTMLYGEWALKAVNSLLTNDLPKLTIRTPEFLEFVTEAFNKRQTSLQEVEKKKVENPYWDYCPTVKEIENLYIATVGGYLENKHQQLQTRWKIYIDKMGYIASMDPTFATYVYGATTNYLSYLSDVSAEVSRLYPEYYSCFPPLPKREDSENSTNRLLDFFCQKGVGGKLPFGVVSVNLNCERFEMSASVEFIKFGYQKKFSNGSSTVWVGAGVEGGFDDIIKINATQKLFLVFDKNNEFSDAGVSGKGEIEIKHLVKNEFGYTFGVNSGFDSGYKGENIFGKNINKAMGFLNLN